MNNTASIVRRALAVGIDARAIDTPKPGTRRHSPLGSTAAPGKIAILNGIRMSIGQARQYIEARESRRMNK